MKFFSLLFCAGISLSLFGQDSIKPADESSMIGQIVPSFSGTSISGMYWNNKSLEGKVAVINFWFIGCLPCMKEIPYFNKLDSIFNDEDFILLSITPHVREDVTLFNSDSINNFSRLRMYLAKQRIEYEIIPTCPARTKTKMDGVNSSIGPDCKIVSEDFNVLGYPATFVIDKKGVIRFVHIGFAVDMENPTADIEQGTEIEDEVRSLLIE